MFKSEKEQVQLKGKVISIVTPQVREYVNHTESVRIVESKNHFKKVVARVISTYLSSPSRPWVGSGGADINTDLLTRHLNATFPEFTGNMAFKVRGSQDAFDIVSFGTGLLVEVKSVKSGAKRLVNNATIYPDKITAINALGDNYNYPTPESADVVLDVLVVCVTHKHKVVDGFSIVDGHYWGVTEELFLECRAYFKAINELLPAINATLSESNSFAKSMHKGTFGDGIRMQLRKLITVTNPVGRLNILGHWPTAN
jgi:hypothetical protein